MRHFMLFINGDIAFYTPSYYYITLPMKFANLPVEDQETSNDHPTFHAENCHVGGRYEFDTVCLSTRSSEPLMNPAL